MTVGGTAGVTVGVTVGGTVGVGKRLTEGATVGAEEDGAGELRLNRLWERVVPARKCCTPDEVAERAEPPPDCALP